MKRFSIFVALIIMMNLLSACRNEADISSADSAAEIFNYNLTDVCSFVPMGNDICVSFRSSGEVAVYNEVGEKTRTLDFGEGVHTNLCMNDDRIYAFTNTESIPCVTVYDLNTDKYTSNRPKNSSIASASTMAVVSDRLYLIYMSDFRDEQQKNVKFDETDDYYFGGETAVSVSMEDFSTTPVDISNVISLKKYSDNEIIYYAYDDIGGYYFTVYNTETEQFSDRVYNNNIGRIFSFAFIDDTNIVWSDFPNRKLTSADITQHNSETDIMSDVVAVYGNDVQYADGRVYVLDNRTGSILRTEYAQAVMCNNEISFCSSEIYSETPYGCGYRINTYMLSDEEFALNILAGNSGYDICMMSSGQSFSQSIRDKGAFYPLDDVPMVSEYLDSCFPYLKEAATDEYGQIWMLPVAVDIPYILYHPENCAEKGIAFDESTSWEYLFSKAEELYQAPELRDKFQLNGYQAEGNILNQYNSFYATDGYDTELFRHLCEMLKGCNIQSSESLHTWIAPISRYNDLTAYYEDYLFELKPYGHSLFEQEAFDMLRAAGLPVIGESTPNCADCIYFCVNMNSDNLEDTLRYISSYCTYMLGRKDTYMLADKSCYSFSGTPLAEDLYRIYSNAEISFALSYEMFWEDYLKYCENQLDIDELISEIGRKTDMYINE